MMRSSSIDPLSCIAWRRSSAAVIAVLVVSVLSWWTSTLAAGQTIRSSHPKSPNSVPRNIQVSHGRYQAYGEPSLAVNPRNESDLLGAAQCINGSALPAPCSFASFDGGRTWQENGPLPLPSGDKGGGDVTAAFNAQGAGFIAAHAGSSWNVDSVLVWRTTDGGRSFSRPVTVFSGRHGANVVDHPSMAVGTASAGRLAPLYVVWTANAGQDFSSRTRLLFSRSSDGGRSFTKPRSIANVAHGYPGIPIVTAGSNGTVHVVYAVGHRDPYSTPFALLARMAVNSVDGGRHFGPPHRIASEPGFGITFAHMKMANIAAAATDAPRGTVYVAMVAYRPGSHRTDILLWQSSNGGTTWAKPVRVNDDPLSDQVDHIQPELVVTPHGTLYVSYFAVARGRVRVYLTHSTTQGKTFGGSERITSVSFDPRLSGQKRVGSPWIGDYEGLASGTHNVYPFWNDTRTGHMEIYTAAVPAG